MWPCRVSNGPTYARLAPSPDEHRYAQSSCHPRFSTVQGETGKMNGRTVDDFGWQERAGDELRCANPRKRSAEGNGKKGLERWTAEHRIGETINSFFPKGVNVGIIFVSIRLYNKYKRTITDFISFYIPYSVKVIFFKFKFKSNVILSRIISLNPVWVGTIRTIKRYE